jgi:hypothetical protein
MGGKSISGGSGTVDSEVAWAEEAWAVAAGMGCAVQVLEAGLEIMAASGIRSYRS